MSNTDDHATWLERKLLVLFPESERRAEAQAILATYGSASHEREPARVRLAVLKLSGPDIVELRANVTLARQDYRDILAWAEYPHQTRAPTWRLPAVERRELVARDRAEYLAWLECKTIRYKY